MIFDTDNYISDMWDLQSQIDRLEMEQRYLQMRCEMEEKIMNSAAWYGYGLESQYNVTRPIFQDSTSIVLRNIYYDSDVYNTPYRDANGRLSILRPKPKPKTYKQQLEERAREIERDILEKNCCKIIYESKPIRGVTLKIYTFDEEKFFKKYIDNLNN